MLENLKWTSLGMVYKYKINNGFVCITHQASSTTLTLGPEEHKDYTRNRPNILSLFTPSPVGLCSLWISEWNLPPAAISSAPSLKSFQSRLGHSLHKLQLFSTSP